MSDDRFARQNRCGPPPEFPLASSYSRIVHHLSGPNVYALAPPRRRCGRDGPVVRPRHRRRGIPPETTARAVLCFHCASRFRNTQRLAHMLDSLVRVSRRVGQVTDRFATDPRPAAGPEDAAPPQSTDTGDSPRQSNGSARPRCRDRPRQSLPRSGSGPTPPGSVTPNPKERPPSPGASHRSRTGRGAPPAGSAPAFAASRRAAPLRGCDDAPDTTTAG